MSIAFAISATAIVSKMNLKDLIEHRKERLKALADRQGGNANLGRLLGYKDGAFIGQMIGGHRPITEKTIASVTALPGLSNWFAVDQKETSSIELDNNPDYPAILRVRFKLSAGASGFAVEYQQNEGTPMVFSKGWYAKKGLTPDRLFAVTVSNESMKPGLNDGDIVVVNTESTTPKDSHVFAVNYEGELVIKRLIRDAGEWWLSSDNADQRRYPRKLCGEGVFLLGEIVHKQSDVI